MADLAAVAATIQGAQIQANYALWAAVIGALAIVVSIYIASKNTIKEIKFDKISESKRDQYIELVEIYTKFLVSSLNLRRRDMRMAEFERDEYWEQHENKYFDLYGSINRVHLITTSEIKVKLFLLEKILTSYQGDLWEYYNHVETRPSSRSLEEGAFNFLKYLRRDLGIVEDEVFERQLLSLRKE